MAKSIFEAVANAVAPFSLWNLMVTVGQLMDDFRGKDLTLLNTTGRLLNETKSGQEGYKIGW